MGACLSCLVPSVDEDSEERRSLLNNGHMYSDEDLQKELAKQQQRQNELNTIVNDLNDHLIDVSTFLTNGSAGVNSALPADHSYASIQDDETISPRIAPAGSEDTERQYPYLMTVEEKKNILQQAASKPKRTIVCDSPLYVTF